MLKVRGPRKSSRRKHDQHHLPIHSPTIPTHSHTLYTLLPYLPPSRTPFPLCSFVILSLCHSVVLCHCHSDILSFCHSLNLSHCHSVTLSFGLSALLKNPSSIPQKFSEVLPSGSPQRIPQGIPPEDSILSRYLGHSQRFLRYLSDVFLYMYI